MSESSAAVPDLDARFDEDYLHFYTAWQPSEQSKRDAGVIRRLLGLTPASEILVVPCGFGRVANHLAAQGGQVSGLDASLLYLTRARQDAADMGVQVEYIEGDMRQLPWAGHFDVIVNWFISFGYFDDATDRRVLAEFRRALASGGRLLIDHVNVTGMARQQPAESIAQPHIVYEREDEWMAFRQRYNVTTGRIEYERICARYGRVSRRVFSVRAFTFVELRDWLLEAGFTRVDGYGRDGGSLVLESPRMIVVAHA
jgi:SAM-dependent methyltransferase